MIKPNTSSYYCDIFQNFFAYTDTPTKNERCRDRCLFWKKNNVWIWLELLWQLLVTDAARLKTSFVYTQLPKTKNYGRQFLVWKSWCVSIKIQQCSTRKWNDKMKSQTFEYKLKPKKEKKCLSGKIASNVCLCIFTCLLQYFALERVTSLPFTGHVCSVSLLVFCFVLLCQLSQ